MKSNTCKNYRFIGERVLPHNYDFFCHRYPKHINVQDNHWCGEFQEKNGKSHLENIERQLLNE